MVPLQDLGRAAEVLELRMANIRAEEALGLFDEEVSIRSAMAAGSGGIEYSYAATDSPTLTVMKETAARSNFMSGAPGSYSWQVQFGKVEEYLYNSAGRLGWLNRSSASFGIKESFP